MVVNALFSEQTTKRTTFPMYIWIHSLYESLGPAYPELIYLKAWNAKHSPVER